MRTSIDGVDLIKNCPKCDALIKIAEKTCNFCGYTWLPTILSPEEAAWSYDQTVEMIHDAFFRIESYGSGKTNRYSSFDFWRMFSVLFEKTREPENQKLRNYSRIAKYAELIHQLATDWDKGRFDNKEAYKNDAFIGDLDTITYIANDRDWEFLEFEVPNKKDRISIIDITNGDEILFEESNHRETASRNELSLRDHFDNIREGHLTELERLNLSERLTDNFKLEKLRLLENDLSIYISMEKEDRQSEFSMEQIAEEVKERHEKNRPIPRLTLPVLKIKGQVIDPEEKPTQVLDIEGLMFPYEFMWCYQFQKFLIKKIQEIESMQKSDPEIKTEPRANAFEDKLNALGFLELEAIKDLQTKQRMEIRSHITKYNIPFTIATLNQIGLPDHLLKTQTKTKVGVHKLLATLLECPERTIKGNLNSLNEHSREDKKRYTAHLHTQEVKRILKEITK